MELRGRIQGGVVVLENGTKLPDGTEVIVLPRSSIPGEKPEPMPAIGEKLAQLAEWAEQQPSSLPEDLAANHDHYLHGLPKRK